MDVFKLYEYEDWNHYGIIFDESVKIGDVKVFDQYKWIKFVDQIKLANDAKIYRGIVFDNVASRYIEIIVKNFNYEWNRAKFSLFSDLFVSYANIFEKTKKSNNKNKYLGLIGELAFIKKSQNLKINNILDFYFNNAFDRFDFHFINDKHVDIKLGNLTKRSFKLNLAQLESLTNEPNNHDVCIIFPYWDDHNGLNLMELFEKIDGNKSLNLVRNSIEELKFENFQIFATHKIDINKSKFIFFKRDFLPRVKFEKINSLIDAIFEIFIVQESKIDFESKVRDLSSKWVN